MPIVLAEGSLVSVNPGLAIWTLVTFLIVASVLRWKVWGPLMKIIEGREQTIQDAVDAARKEREEAQKILADQQAAAEQARKETAELIRQNRVEVDKAKEELFAKARAEADALLAQARRTIEDEKRKAMAEVREVAVSLAINAAGNLLEKNLDDTTQRRLAEDYLGKLPQVSAKA